MFIIWRKNNYTGKKKIVGAAERLDDAKDMALGLNNLAKLGRDKPKYSYWIGGVDKAPQ